MNKWGRGSTGTWVDVLLFVGFINIFLFNQLGAMAGVLLMLGIWVLTIATFGRGANPKIVMTSLVVTTVISITSLYVGSPEKMLMLGALWAGNLIMTSYSLVKKSSISGLLELLLSPLIMVKEYFYGAVSILVEMLSGNLEKILTLGQTKSVNRSSYIKSILTGLVLGTPLIIWLVVTLVQADPIFAKFVGGLVSPDFWNLWAPRLMISVMVFIITAPLLFIRYVNYVSPLSFLAKINWNKEMNVIASMVFLVMASFLIIQWPYVFATVAKETDLSQFGVATYSEYVQRGFGDLLKVALTMFIVGWAGLLSSRNSKGLDRKIHLIIQTLIGAEFVIFIFSMFRRVWLYQSHHGLSLARLYGLVVLIWIVGMMISMVMRYIYPKVSWVKIEMGWMVIVIMGTIAVNLEQYVVKQPPTVNNRIDYVYLSRLPSDGYTGWVMAYDWANDTLSNHSSEPGIIGKDARRDTHYSGLIAWQLSRNYHKLVMQYGTESEVKDYIAQVLDTKRELVELLSMSKIDREREIELIVKAKKNLESEDWIENVNVNMFQLSPEQMYHWVYESREEERYLGIDRFLAYSASDQRLYEQMKSEITIEKLLDIQQMDLMMRKRIAGQPSSEREFEIDISMDGPFLR